jgi:hypothetical protein
LTSAILLFSHGQRPGTIDVPAGADLQLAIDRAEPGQTIVLAPGATYEGNFLLPDKRGDRYITIRTGGSNDGLPAPGERVLPRHAAKLAKLKSATTQPVLRTAPGAHHWRLELLEFLPTKNGHGDIIALGDGGARQHDLAQVPHDLEVDRCFIHGDSEKGQKRGIALNSASTSITGSYIADIKGQGQDTQAIAGWNGPGPYTIENNYLEGAGENFILGGSDPPIRGLVTTGVVFRRNHLAKPVEWRGERWQVKNLFELKNARRVLVEANVMEYVWKEAQVGYAILITPRNQDGGAPWVTVEDVTIRGNIVRHAGGGMQITGEDSNYPSGSTSGVTVTDNLFYGIDSGRWGGTGAFLLVGNGPARITIEHNTISQTGNILSAYGGTKDSPRTVEGFVFRQNIVRHNEYGVHGSDRAVGNDTLRAYFPGSVFEGNVIAGGEARRYPARNIFISGEEFAPQFLDLAAGDFRPAPGSRLHAPNGPRAAGADPDVVGRARAALSRNNP